MSTIRSCCRLVLAGGLGMCVFATLVVTPILAKTHDVSMTAVETDVIIDGSGEKYAAWTFNGTMPGPVVRVTEGDTVKFTLTNPATNKYPHAMDFHAAEIDFLLRRRVELLVPVPDAAQREEDRGAGHAREALHTAA